MNDDDGYDTLVILVVAFLGLCILCLGVIYSNQSKDDMITANINITSIGPIDGSQYLQLFDSNNRGYEISGLDLHMSYGFLDIKPGQYVISYYCDKDNIRMIKKIKMIETTDKRLKCINVSGVCQ